MMQAEVIAIGDELTSGQRLDTNSQWISRKLGELGIRTLYHSTVGDDLTANIRVFREAIDRAELIICTGGLGPTADDLTRQAIAEATGVELKLDEDSLAHIQGLFSRRREMPKSNIIQAMFPSGSQPVPNPHGSAPGIDMEIPRTRRSAARIFALPGVPAEMKEMWEQTVEPSLQQIIGGGRKIIRHRRIKCFGAGESDLEQMLPNLIQRGRRPAVGITVSKATITLRITADGESAGACYAEMEPTIEEIHRCLGKLVFGEEDDELQHVVVRMLSARERSLATAEWGAGGLLASWLSEAGMHTRTYLGGIVVGPNAADEGSAIGAEINLSQESPADQNKAAKLAIEELAQNARKRYGAYYGLAMGPIPEPIDQSRADDPPKIYFSLAGPEGARTIASPYAGHPDILRDRSAKQALNLLRLSILESESE